MKYDEIPENYHSPYMVQVAEKLSILKMTPEERANYSYYQKKLYSDRDELAAAEARGIERGIEKGKTEEKMEIARAMLLDGDTIEKISKITGLTFKDIEKLK
jgi:predicted transposase/invertase (TIGR01784 family)